ncbi:unnamed protein product, partial [Discosporangium mesarthrocarpum]
GVGVGAGNGIGCEPKDGRLSQEGLAGVPLADTIQALEPPPQDEPDGEIPWAFMLGGVLFVMAPRGCGRGYRVHKRLREELRGTILLRGVIESLEAEGRSPSPESAVDDLSKPQGNSGTLPPPGATIAVSDGYEPCGGGEVGSAEEGLAVTPLTCLLDVHGYRCKATAMPVMWCPLAPPQRTGGGA